MILLMTMLMMLQMMMILVLSALVAVSVAQPLAHQQTCLDVLNSLGELAEHVDVDNMAVADLEEVTDTTIL